MRWPMMLRTTHEMRMRSQERRLIEAMLDEVNRARLVMLELDEWCYKLRKAKQPGHYCDAMTAADAVAQSMTAFKRANSNYPER